VPRRVTQGKNRISGRFVDKYVCLIIALLVNPNTGAERMEGMIHEVQEDARVKGVLLHT
jgi:hypothetical protein